MNTREAFIQEVKKFKSFHKKKLKECLNEKSAPHTTGAFFENPIIHAYLSRSANDVQFSETHPLLTDSLSKEDHEKTDHYELKVYKLLPDVIAYRSDTITTSKYYSEGSSCKRFIEEKIKAFNKESEDIDVLGPCDIYNITAINSWTSLARLFKVEDNTSRFKIVSNWKDQHATTVLSIFDKDSHRPLVSLFINSSESSRYYDSMKLRFEQVQDWYIKDLSPTISESVVTDYLNELFSIDINCAATQNSRILISDTGKTALCLGFEHEDLWSKEYDQLENNKNIETIYLLYKNQSTYAKNAIKLRYETPFMEASHDLQIAKDDYNCVLYSLNFIEAMVKFLKQPDVADKIYSLAMCINQKNNQSEKAEIELVKLFKENLKTYLPNYYDKENSKKTLKTIQDHHLKQRWTLGCESLSLFYPIKQNEIDDLPDSKNGLAASFEQKLTA